MLVFRVVGVVLHTWHRATREMRAHVMSGAVIDAPTAYADGGLVCVPLSVTGTAMLEAVYLATQNDCEDGPLGWRSNVAGATTGMRSLSVGDLAVVDGRWFRVLSMGWQALPAAEQVTFTAAFPALVDGSR